MELYYYIPMMPSFIFGFFKFLVLKYLIFFYMLNVNWYLCQDLLLSFRSNLKSLSIVQILSIFLNDSPPLKMDVYGEVLIMKKFIIYGPIYNQISLKINTVTVVL